MNKTDDSGIAIIKNLPEGSYRFGVFEKEWDMPIDPASGDRNKRVRMRDKDRNVTIKLYPKGTLPKNNQPPLSETILKWWNELGDGNE